MPKFINLGNGTVLIGLDKFAQIKDFYYHYPGLENHVSENLTHKIGIFVDGKFSWVDDGSWSFHTLSKSDAMESDITLKSDNLGIELHFSDCVYNEKNIFIREIKVRNLFDRRRSLKLFFNQQFNISQTHTGETAFYDPRDECIIHYKGRRVFLINTIGTKRGFDDYSVGLLGIEGKDGTFRDAEDGVLSKNPIEHGAVDSVIALDLDIEAKADFLVYYWICVAKSIAKVKSLNEEVLVRHPHEILVSTSNYWKAWVTLRNFSFYGLSDEAKGLFNKSLFNIRSHFADNGGIIASGDSEMLQFGRDYYEYVWPRDAALTIFSLIKAGDLNASKRFFKFCEDTVTAEGYFMHKYRPDKSLGSSWHPWIRDGKEQFPIQEDALYL